MQPTHASRAGFATLTIAVVVLCGAALDADAATRKVTFPTAFRPDAFNTVAASRTEPVAFVASRETDTVFAFDPRTGASIGQVEVGDGPLFINILEREGRRLLAVTCDGILGSPRNVITVVDATDPARPTVTGTALLPEGYIFLFAYQSVQFAPNGSALIVAASDATTARGLLLTYDIASGAEVGRLQIGFAPGGSALVARADRTLVAVTQSTAPRGRVTIVDVSDLAAPRIHARVVLPSGSGAYDSNNVAFSRDGRAGYIASGDGNALYVFDVDTGRVLSRTPSGLFPTTVLAFEQNGLPRLLVVAEVSAALLLFDVADPAAPRLLGDYRAPSVLLDTPPVVSADGRTAFAAAVDGDRLYSVDLTTGALNYLSSAGDVPAATAVWEGPDALYVCVLGAASQDVTCLRAGPFGFQQVGRFTGPPAAVTFSVYQNLALSGDGRYLFAASGSTDELYAIDVEAARLVGRVRVGVRPSQVALAEDPATGRRSVAVVAAGDAALVFVDAGDPADLRITGVTPLESAIPYFLEFTNVVFTADASTAFVADGLQFVYAVDARTAEIVGSLGTGFNPVTLALREDGGRRQLAVLNTANENSGIAIVDVTSPQAMARIASYAMPQGVVPALNNIPRFTLDGRYVLAGASVSNTLFVIDAATGALAGTIEGTDAIHPTPFSDGDRQKFVAVNLGDAPTRIYRLGRSGAPRGGATLEPPAGSYFIVGNDAVVAEDGTSGLIPNYGRQSVLRFDPRSGAVTGELSLGGGPGQTRIDWARGRALALEVNGTASSVIIADLSDLGAPAAPRKLAVSRATSRAAGMRGGPAAGPPSPGPAVRSATYSTTLGKVVPWKARSKQR